MSRTVRTCQRTSRLDLAFITGWPSSLKSVLRPLTRLQARFNAVYDWVDVGQGVDCEVSSGLLQLATRVPQSDLAFCRRQCVPPLFADSDHVSGLGHTDGPASGIQTFFNIADCVSNFYDGFKGIDFHANCVFVDHPWKRAPGADVVGTQDAIGNVALTSRTGKQNLHQRAGIASRAANLEPAVAQAFDRAGHSRNHVRTLHQAGHLLRNEVGEQILHLVFSRGLAEALFPLIGYAFGMKQRANVIFLQNSHVAASLLFGDLDSAISKDLFEDPDRGQAAVIDRGPRPIQNHSLQATAIRLASVLHDSTLE